MKSKKQRSYKKLELHRETLRQLDAAELGLVVGGEATTSVDNDCHPSQEQCPDVRTTGA